MIEDNTNTITRARINREKILLAILPFWDTQIPPLGIASLKSYLQQHGYEVKTVDANLEIQFRKLYDDYYEILEQVVPTNKQGNIFNIGNQVLRNHLMAYINTGETERHNRNGKYWELLKIVVMKTFFTEITTDQLMQLDRIPAEFFLRLRKYLLELLEKEKPTVLGLTVYCDTFPASLAAFRWAKETIPSIKTLMGGGIFADQLAPGSPELDFFVERYQAYIDKIIIGEGEALMLQFLRGKLENKQKVCTLKDLDDLQCPPLQKNEERYIDLSAVNIPDYMDFDLLHYQCLAHYGARSCPYQCKFCSETINWGKYRKKDVEQTVQELIELNRLHQYQLFLLTDSTLNPIISDLAREFTKSGVTIYWDGFLRAEPSVCSISNTMLWRRGGFYRAKLGLESGSQRVLDLMNKRILIRQSQEALMALAYAGIKTTTYWLFGYPGETEEDFQLSLDFLEKNKDCIYEAHCNGFYYYLTGQANSEEWRKNNKGVLLYPGWAREYLVTQTWMLEEEPSRETTYSRINRFVQHCKKLGIPNPYSLNDVYAADERWKKLHKNSVPPVVELKNKKIVVEENKHVKAFSFAENKLQDEGDWF